MARKDKNFTLRLFVPQILSAMAGASEVARIEFARHVVSLAADESPRERGTNAASIGWIKSDGIIHDRDMSKRKGGGAVTRARDARDVARKGEITIVTSSGYGGYLEVGTQFMRAFRYLRRSLIRVSRNVGFIAKPMAEAFEKLLEKQTKRLRRRSG